MKRQDQKEKRVQNNEKRGLSDTEIKCADCQCIPQLWSKQYFADCQFCVKNDCCCIEIHLQEPNKTDYTE